MSYCCRQLGPHPSGTEQWVWRPQFGIVPLPGDEKAGPCPQVLTSQHFWPATHKGQVCFYYQRKASDRKRDRDREKQRDRERDRHTGTWGRKQSEVVPQTYRWRPGWVSRYGQDIGSVCSQGYYLTCLYLGSFILKMGGKNSPNLIKVLQGSVS